MSELPYRPCVGVMLLDRRGRAFVGRRRAKRSDPVAIDHEWQMPQGGIDEGEEPFAAALRELHEETNVTSVALLGEARDWYSYDLPPEAMKRWTGKYRGQTQRWFALRFLGEESEIDIERPAGGAHEPEFDAWRWEAPSRLPELIVPFKRAVYERVVEDFAHLGAE
ncbi:RNA pyrophosphohydrolase [Methylosinus trichosporium]|uniref:RNA pyrophosphohydrolase n=1 Tax=Methylosinus trichosporium (strain ATCC 35070 / NCIMB 11131 / UNIQEM 75 / OB3b) TaxID=595536 RepID=A0A2D2D4I7_METT3|nr:RNA pyrophosphohydrolase [Methylosinus trichosporium]ATQ69875.1 RNA pyrophosphohydrolase [Methylosinus trichosporium OB3b]